MNNPEISITNESQGCAQSEPFALQVTGHTMEPEFPDGCIIIVEPGAVLEEGSYVVANVDGGSIFRQLRKQQNIWQLHALGGDEPVVNLKDRYSIRGRVIQRAGKRRKDRKFYP